MDGKGFAFGQRHVAAFLQGATDSMLVIGTLPPMSRAQADQATYNDYPVMVKRSHTHHIDVQHHCTCHPHHAGKHTVVGKMATLLLGYGQTTDEIVLHSVGETIAVHDSGVAVWKN